MGNIDNPVLSAGSLELMGARQTRRDPGEADRAASSIAQGNSTTEFLNYVTALGVVENRPPTFIKHKPVKGVGTCPIAFWTM